MDQGDQLDNENHPETHQDDSVQKKGRHRKKQLYNSILHQMEFYFSDSNLSKDRFLSQLIQENSYVDLSVFLKFNKIRKLTDNLDDIRKALRKSELLEVSEDGQSICRKTPVKARDNVDDCTIYVEKIKADATHEWVQSVFAEFGNVVYVSIPKYKNTKVNKGFAFVEFETEKEAENALEFFESIGCKMPSHLNPEELCSISTFQKDDSDDIFVAKVEKDEKQKETSNEMEVQEESSKKRKRSAEIDEGNFKKLKSDDESEVKSDQKEPASESDDCADKKKKKKKEHKKKNHIKELGLQVLSKKEWKKMRNHYLDSQRKKMKEFKRYLNNKRFSQQNYSDKNDKSKESTENNEQATKQEEAKLEFTPGVIVKVKLSEPCADTRKLKGFVDETVFLFSDKKALFIVKKKVCGEVWTYLKLRPLVTMLNGGHVLQNEIKSSNSDAVKYIDIPIGSEEIYVRFGDSSSAQEFCKQDGFGEKALLQSDEEKSYWEKIQSDRKTKLNKIAKKERGRDKLLKKAKKEMAQHIRFEEET